MYLPSIEVGRAVWWSARRAIRWRLLQLCELRGGAIVDKDQPIATCSQMEQTSRAVASLVSHLILSVFAAWLVLAGVGIYGVMSYAVARRHMK